MSKASEFRWQRRVAFAETDMAGILHFANYFRYMEECEHAFFRSLGQSVHVGRGDDARGFARGECTCRYERPLVYEDVVELHLLVRAIGRSSMSYEFFFENDGERIARGKVTTVHIGRGEGGRMRSFELPVWIHERIAVAAATPEASGR